MHMPINIPPAPPKRPEDTRELRDYFAAAALQGLLATDAMDKGAQHVSPEVNERAMAMACYALADAMLQARKEK